MKKKHFTLMIIPDVHADVKRVQLSRTAVYGSALVALGVVAIALAVFVHYSFIIGQMFEAKSLSAENARLKERITQLGARIDSIDGQLRSVRRFDEKLRAMTDLRDEGRELAMGPLRAPIPVAGGDGAGALPFATELSTRDPALGELKDALLDSRLSGLAHEVQAQLASLGALVDDFKAREDLLSSTPSTWPTRGWLTSTFGPRDDPFTGERIMHLGVDLAAPAGTQVRAPAGGVVLFSGERGAYGNMIAISHGRGIVTHYAHLSRRLVKTGEQVVRGQHLGAVGNTGRSTGPHLHYEIRVHGVPVNPTRFVLD